MLYCANKKEIVIDDNNNTSFLWILQQMNLEILLCGVSSLRTDNWDKSTFLLLAFFVSVFLYLVSIFLTFMRLQIAIIFVFRGQH